MSTPPVMHDQAEYARDLRNVLSFGMISVALLASLSLVGVPTGIVNISLRDTMLVALAGVLVSVLGLIGLWLKWPLRQMARYTLLAWTVIATLAVHFTGGPQTPMPALYVLVTVAASFLLGRRDAFLIACVGLGLYAISLALEYSGALPIVQIWNMAFEPRGRELLLVVNLMTVAAPTLVAALLAGTQAERLAERTRQSDELRQQVSERLLGVQQANRQLRALQTSLSTFQSVLDLDQTFKRIAAAVCGLGYTAASIATFNEQEERLHIRASATTMGSEMVRATEALMGRSLTGAAFTRADAQNIGISSFLSGKVLVSRNLYDFYHPMVTPDVAAQIAQMIKFGCGASIPLRAEGRSVGNLFALTMGSTLSEADLNLLQAFADQAAVVVERAQLFAEVQRGRDQLQAVLNSTRDGIMMFNHEGVLTTANPAAAELLGLDETTVKALVFSDVLTHLGRQAGLEPSGLLDLETVYANPDATSTRRTFEIMSPPHRYVELISWPVSELGEDVMGRLAVLHDVTHQKELEAARDEMAHMLVHDLRGPLSSIIAGMYLAKETVKNEDISLATHSVDLALEGAERLLELINLLLDVYKLEAGQATFELADTDVPRLVIESMRPFESAACSERIELVAQATPDVPIVQADQEALKRVLGNLIDNALKFTPKGGQVTVRAEARAEAIQVSVIDSGPGIPLDARGHIFEKFSQVPGSQGKRRGTGLGLAFCRLAVEAHGGRIWVECPPEGGSAFIFSIPLRRELSA